MSAGAAKRRALVTLPNGRTGRLVYWPVDPLERRKPRRSRGRRARVELRPGVVVSVDPAALVIHPAPIGEPAR